MGLLEKTLLVNTNTSKPASLKDIFEAGIDFYAQFTKIDNYFYISNSYNIDYDTIFSSWSTCDFWAGSIKNKGQINFFYEKDNSLAQFYQFFSFNLKDKIKAIAIYYTDSKIVMLGSNNDNISNLSKDKLLSIDTFFTKNNTPQEAKDIQKPQNTNVYQLTIDISECVETIIAENIADKEKSKLFSESLCHELQNRLFMHFAEPNYCIHKDSTISNIALFTKAELSEEMILNHLIYNLSDFAQENAQLVNLRFLGKSKSYAALLEFLQA